ncbi:NlpC/P60 family protein [Aeromicrobium sp. CF3.5]|uniref:C40 family peptidase n=1 Tax=Aeromicrobium sp. CF3.5 TaxID=3373078 RepID=UPI003EE81CA1
MLLTRSTARRIMPVLAVSLAAAFVAMPAQAEPDVTAKDVDAAFRAAERANEQVNQLGEDVKETSREIKDLQAEIAEQRKKFEAQRDVLGASIVQQQIDAPLGTTASLLGSGDAETFIDGLGAVQVLNSTRADQLGAFTRMQADLNNREAQLEDSLDSRKADQEKAAATEAKVRDKYEEAKSALAALSVPERETFEASSAPEVEAQDPADIPTNVKADGRVQSAVDFALSQVGKPYVYGATGPDGYDCSGLIQTSFSKAGISLPRVVGPQMGATQSVSMSDLQPGDLVAYGDMSHNGLYIGNGQVVHAPRPGKNVEITSVDYGFNVAGRVG